MLNSKVVAFFKQAPNQSLAFRSTGRNFENRLDLRLNKVQKVAGLQNTLEYKSKSGLRAFDWAYHQQTKENYERCQLFC